MNKFRMAKAGINVNDAIGRLGGDTEGYEKLLVQYLDCNLYEDMVKNKDEGDAEAAFQSAHALKGIAANLSLSKLYEAIVPVVEILRSGSLDIDAGLPAIKEADEKVKTAISDMVES